MTPTAPLWRTMAAAVDRRFGLVHAVQQMMVEPGDPRIWICGTKVPNYEHVFGTRLPESGGAGLSLEAAYSAALGEALERYSAACWEPDEVVEASYDDLAPDAVHPRSWSLFSEGQYRRGIEPFERFETDSIIRWVVARSVVTGQERWVPAQFVHLRHDHNDPRLTMTTSSGLATGATFEAAVLGALCELIERDATMIFWLNRLPLPSLVIDDNCSTSSIFEATFGGRGLSFHLFDATSDIGVPVVVAFLLDEAHPSVATVFGSACQPQGEAAALKALTEAAQTRIWLRDRLPKWEAAEPTSFSEVLDFADHVRLFGQRAMRRHLDFLSRAPRSHPLSQLHAHETPGRAGLDDVLARVAERNLDVLAVDVTTADVAVLGVRVVRVIVPGLVQLTAVHEHRMLGGDRLYHVPVALGYQDRPNAEEELNPVPHPFP